MIHIPCFHNPRTVVITPRTMYYIFSSECTTTYCHLNLCRKVIYNVIYAHTGALVSLIFIFEEFWFLFFFTVLPSEQLSVDTCRYEILFYKEVTVR